MIILSNPQYRRIGVLGLGKTGIATVLCLLRSGHMVHAWEDNPQTIPALLNHPQIAQAVKQGLLLLNPSGELNITAIVISPGIGIVPPSAHPLAQRCKAAGIPIICDIDLLQEACPAAHYIGITGTNGKSTTTALLGHIFGHLQVKHQTGGNIGYPVLDLQPLKEDGHYILETSSFQLERTKARFHIAVLLNISPDHLNRYHDLAAYINAKSNIFAHQQPQDFAILNIDDPEVEKIATSISSRLVPFSTTRLVAEGFGIIGRHIVWNGGICAIPELRYLPGEHNRQNVLAAFAVAITLGMPASEVMQAIREFQGLPHRLQLIKQIGELLFVNDSKATNADSCAKALETYDNIYLIAGGLSKDQGLCALEHLFHKLRHVYLIGEAADKFALTLQQHRIPHTIAGTLHNAIKLLEQLNPSKGVILLSPACASYDQWNNFEHRGQVFCQLIEQYWPAEEAE